MKSIVPGILVVLVAANARAQPTSGPITLSLDKAIKLALEQQPSLRQSKATAEAAYGRVDLAKVARNPVLSLNGSLGAASGRTVVLGTGGVPSSSSGSFFSETTSTGVGASASWRIYDFGQTSANIRAAQLNADALLAGIDTAKLDIVLNVDTAYLSAIATGKLVIVAQSTVKSEEAHLDQAKRFVAAQAKDPIEVAQAQARLANARSALAQAQSNQAVALGNLRAAIGWVDPASSFVTETAWPQPPESDPASLGALVAQAREHRPEILQLDRQIAAAGASLDAAHAERRPVLSASASALWGPGSGDWSPEPSWQAGLTLSFPVFDGGKSAADVRIAKANVTGVQAQRDSLLVSLTSALDTARSQIVANHANVQASTEAVAAARAQLQLAEARYTQGLGSQIELTDAQTAVTTAEGNLVSAEFQLASAWVQLKRALGEV